MPDSDDDRGRSRIAQYLALAHEKPALFENSADGGLVLLLDEADIHLAERNAAKRLERQGLPRTWADVGIVYEDEYLFILRDGVRFPDGESGTYVRIVNRECRSTGVAVLPIWNAKVLLVRHFRHSTRAWHLEIPRGFASKGLSSEESARAELAEETGSIASRLVPLGGLHTDTGLTSERVDLFFAETAQVGRPEKHEAIAELLSVGVEECERLIRVGEITDSFTIAAYTRSRLQGLL